MGFLTTSNSIADPTKMCFMVGRLVHVWPQSLDQNVFAHNVTRSVSPSPLYRRINHCLSCLAWVHGTCLKCHSLNTLMRSNWMYSYMYNGILCFQGIVCFISALVPYCFPVHPYMESTSHTGGRGLKHKNYPEPYTTPKTPKLLSWKGPWDTQTHCLHYTYILALPPTGGGGLHAR